MDFAYPGGKNGNGIWQWLIGLMPTHSMYAEPFAGKGGLLRRKPPALKSVLVDKDAAVIDWWQRLAWPGTTVIHGDGIFWLEEFGPKLDEDWLVYCDPTYLPETRVKKRLYAHELTDAEHVRILRAARAVAAPVMISGYPSTLYDRELRDWHTEGHLAMTRGGTMRMERVWCNYNPARLAPAIAAAVPGDDYRQRERIGRKMRRWVRMWQAMPEAERRAILLALISCSHAAGGDSRGHRHGRRGSTRR